MLFCMGRSLGTSIQLQQALPHAFLHGEEPGYEAMSWYVVEVAYRKQK